MCFLLPDKSFIIINFKDETKTKELYQNCLVCGHKKVKKA